nr:MAG TPA: hypothetical protein [Caudoviricetes sp.]
MPSLNPLVSAQNPVHFFQTVFTVRETIYKIAINRPLTDLGLRQTRRLYPNLP